MDNLYNITINNGEQATIHVYNDDVKNYYYVDVLNFKNKIIASAYFNIKPPVCYLNRIEVCNDKYLHQGVCTKVLTVMEKIAKECLCKTIDGKFFPFGEFGKYAATFYIKNGYEIYKDGYETYIYKDLTKTSEKTI